MRFVKLLGVALAAVAVGIGATGALAGAAPSARPETVFLDSFTANDSSGGNSLQASTVLTVGKKYLIEVSGTFSAWQDWGPEACGVPGAAPTYDSPTRAATEVGDDAVFRFAAPESGGSCGSTTYPYASKLFQINLGSGWEAFAPLVNRTKPNKNHTYFAVVTGQGSAPMFKITDWYPSDNDGELKITIF